MGRRAFKVQEFPAHSANVNCLRIGRKSSQVLVTGGDDKKVNVWAIGKPNAILSLAGHTSPVESVCFDSNDEVVVAGAGSGTVKLWDLEQAKVIRTLTGHRSNCVAVDFHPYGDFFASGSMDTNLKVWDIRRKSCIQTYKGHTKTILQVRFSPDGRWVVSGGEDGSVKLWDLTAGKLMHDFTAHEGDITSVDYHPSEFLLATGSTDRTVKFWDLETFDMIASTQPETTPIRSISFTPDGKALLSATQDSLKVWDWEPIKCHDVIDVSWNKVADMSINSSFQLVGCTFNQSFCGVWVVNLQTVAPYSTDGSNGATDLAPPQIATNPKEPARTTDREYLHRKDPLQPATRSAAMPQPATPAVLAARAAEAEPAPNPAQSNTVAHVPAPAAAASAGAASQSRTTASATTSVGTSLSKSVGTRESKSIDVQQKDTAMQQAHPAEVSRPELSNTGNHVSMGVGPEPDSARRPPASELVDGLSQRLESLKTSRRDSTGRTDELAPRAAVNTSAAQAAPAVQGIQQAVPPSVHGMQQAVPPSVHGMQQAVNSSRPPSRKVTEFIEEADSKVAGKSELETIERLLRNHDQMCAALGSRLDNIAKMKALWKKGDIKGTLELMASCGDLGAAVDILSMVWSKSNLFTLDSCGSLLPLLKELLASPHDEYVITAMQVLQILLQNFGPIITQTRSLNPSGGPVDIQMEERMRKCNYCHQHLLHVQYELNNIKRNSGKVGELLRVLRFTLQNICSK